MVNHTLSDALIRIKNGYMAGKVSVELPFSKLVEAVCRKLVEKKYLTNVKQDGLFVSVDLLYKEGNPAVSNIKIVSKPGRRVYVSKKEIKNVLSGKGISVISTPFGVMTGSEARQKNIGGELLCEVFLKNMSRIGKKPVKVVLGVSVEINGSYVTVKGPKGEMAATFRPEISLKKDNDLILVERVSETAKAKSLHGLTRTLVENMIFGVDKGWNKGLEIVGTGYRAEGSGSQITLYVGFSHAVKFDAPKGITLEVKQNIINVTGVDKQLVGETTAKIRAIKPPEPYKGKGIRYVGEVVRKKAGKAAKAGAGPAAGK